MKCYLEPKHFPEEAMGQAVSERTAGNGTGTNGHGPTTIKSYAPATGELIGEVPVLSADEVRKVVESARTAQKAWGALPLEDRCERILRFKDAIVERTDE